MTGAASTRTSVSLPFLNASFSQPVVDRRFIHLFRGWESLITFHLTRALDRHFIRILSIHTHIQGISRIMITPPTRAGGPPTLVAHRPVLTVQGSRNQSLVLGAKALRILPGA
ncbi:hypothetical protein PAPYR_7276 [Paratrimastix pyriformis]|uniref:Uncharacterized protein n=1 Tax=Paratrimastix pyriformis TaxID=342808 RepID=A0ABQ8UDF1_9EUKA|nr:hypothetical protein PAPYR_7276 [Paratrimastix pyriformis]